MRHLRLIHTQAAKPVTAELAVNEWGFNSHDRIALTCWTQRTEAHGYRRVLIEGGAGDGGPEEGSYVLIYAPQGEWASWGIARSGNELVVWNCGSGADLGRFPTMLQALESLPPVWTRPKRQQPGPTGRHPADRAVAELPRPVPRLYLVHPN